MSGAAEEHFGDGEVEVDEDEDHHDHGPAGPDDRDDDRDFLASEGSTEEDDAVDALAAECPCFRAYLDRLRSSRGSAMSGSSTAAASSPSSTSIDYDSPAQEQQNVSSVGSSTGITWADFVDAQLREGLNAGEEVLILNQSQQNGHHDHHGRGDQTEPEDSSIHDEKHCFSGLSCCSRSGVTESEISIFSGA